MGDTKWKWAKRLFFHLLDLAIVKSYILLSSSGGKKISHRNFRFTLITEMLARSGYESRQSMPVGRTTPASKNIGRLDTHHNKLWPGLSNTNWRCRLCSATGVTRKMIFKCVKCDEVSCEDRSCFADYHTKETYKTSSGPSSVPTDEVSTTM